MIIEDILNERGNTLLSAEDNVGKSLMANHVGNVRSFFKLRHPKKGYAFNVKRKTISSHGKSPKRGLDVQNKPL